MSESAFPGKDGQSQPLSPKMRPTEHGDFSALSVRVPVGLRLSIVKTRMGQETEKLSLAACSGPHKLLQRSEKH